MSRRQRENYTLSVFLRKHVWVPTLLLSGSSGGSMDGWMTDRQLAQEMETEREMGAAVCACQRQGHPLGDFKPWHCHFSYHGDTANEHLHRKIAENFSISVKSSVEVISIYKNHTCHLSFSLFSCPLFYFSVWRFLCLFLSPPWQHFVVLHFSFWANKQAKSTFIYRFPSDIHLKTLQLHY